MKKKARKESRYVSRLAVMFSGVDGLIDMMRYDDCFPASEVESGKIARVMGRNDKPGDHLVQLTRASASDGPPTHDRWRSFGCRVLDVRHPDESPWTDAELQSLKETSASDDYTTLHPVNYPARFTAATAYAVRLAQRLLGITIGVRVIDGPALTCWATWGRSTPPMLTLNQGRLPAAWFARGPGVDEHYLLIHEFAHHYGDHLEEKFDDAMAKLGAKLAELALTEPAFFESWRKVAT